MHFQSFFLCNTLCINHDIKPTSLSPLMFMAVSPISGQVLRCIEQENVLFGLGKKRSNL